MINSFKLLFVFFIGIIAGCCSHTQNFQHTRKIQSNADMVNSTVALVHYKDKHDNIVDAENKNGIMKVYCSGVWITHNIFLTAAHCVEDIGKPEKQIEEILIDQILGLKLPKWDPTGHELYFSTRNDIWDEQTKDYRGSHKGTIIAYYSEYDLALVQAKVELNDLQIPMHAVANLAEELEIGSDVKIVGHPGGMWWTFTKGTISAIHTKVKNPRDETINAIQISAPVWFGNSGGGAFNENGELVGICSWIRDIPNTSFFIHPSIIRIVLRENNIIF